METSTSARQWLIQKTVTQTHNINEYFLPLEIVKHNYMRLHVDDQFIRYIQWENCHVHYQELLISEVSDKLI